MADCCQNTVTPKMIKLGQVAIGDKINLEDEVIEVQGPAPMQASSWQGSHQDGYQSNQQTNQQQNILGIPGGVIRRDTGSNQQRRIIPYEEMTQYMNNISPSGTMENPAVLLPQSPLSPQGYQEEIDNAALQSFNGFLRTQIGRYIRVEQLVTSERTEDRLGFLVGVGSNFIILQDITTGNILVIDIFSIRLTYVYYSEAVIPEF